MELALARYRLLFHHSFGTAHGLRDGTDSVFVRLTEGDLHGYGEATLPPYLPETQDAVIQEIIECDLEECIRVFDAILQGSGMVELNLSTPARAAISTAYLDLRAKGLGQSVSSMFLVGMDAQARTMVTIGHTEPSELASRLAELPASNVLKVKLGGINDKLVLSAVKRLNSRPLFLDANQGWTNLDQAMEAIGIIGEDRVLGLEQPFDKGRWDLHKALRSKTGVSIYGDESIQGMADLERATEAFDGVNLKLMKSGGLDIAQAMSRKARELGLKVMLGSMSESNLGCSAMAMLAGSADLLDLDGPWLIKNDPFEGLGMKNGSLTTTGGPGVGVVIRKGTELDWTVVRR